MGIFDKLYEDPRRRRARVRVRGRSGRSVTAPVYQTLEQLFGVDLFAQYTPASLFQDAGKTTLATPGSNTPVWGDEQGNFDLDVERGVFLGYDPAVPTNKANAALLNGHVVFGSGNIYDPVTGAVITTEGDPTVEGIFDGFVQGGFDGALDTYCLFMVCKNLIDDNPLLTIISDDGFTEARAIAAEDHHPTTGNVLSNFTDAGVKVQAYQGPDGDNLWHGDGAYRVVCAVLSLTRANNALWVNGVKYAAGTGLPVQGTVDTGANADLLVPTLPTLFMVNDSVPTAEMAIIKNVQPDEKILEACRKLGQKYAITVA